MCVCGGGGGEGIRSEREREREREGLTSDPSQNPPTRVMRFGSFHTVLAWQQKGGYIHVHKHVCPAWSMEQMYGIGHLA